jgi:hypothetical protein
VKITEKERLTPMWDVIAKGHGTPDTWQRHHGTPVDIDTALATLASKPKNSHWEITHHVGGYPPGDHVLKPHADWNVIRRAGESHEWLREYILPVDIYTAQAMLATKPPAEQWEIVHFHGDHTPSGHVLES